MKHTSLCFIQVGNKLLCTKSVVRLRLSQIYLLQTSVLLLAIFIGNKKKIDGTCLRTQTVTRKVVMLLILGKSLLLVSSCFLPVICYSFLGYIRLNHRYRSTSKLLTMMHVQEQIEMDPIDQPLKVVEFFSGIGGWSSALKLQKTLKFDVVAAYDVNSISNEVYKHVHGIIPSSSAIESLSLKLLESHKPDIWVRTLDN